MVKIMIFSTFEIVNTQKETERERARELAN